MGGHRTAVGEKVSVSKLLGQLKTLSSNPRRNLKQIHIIFGRLLTKRLKASERDRLISMEQRVYALLSPRERLVLYSFPLPKGYKPIPQDLITTKRQALAALKGIKDPRYYLPQIQHLYHKFPSLDGTTEMRKVMLKLRKSLVQPDFVKSKPYEARTTMALGMRGSSGLDMDELERASRRGKTARGGRPVKVRRTEILESRETQHDLLPPEYRMVSSSIKRPKLVINPQLAAMMGNKTATQVQESFIDMVIRNNPKQAGKTWYNTAINWMNAGTGMTGLPDPKNAGDPRWAKATQLLGGLVSTQKGRETAVDILKAMKSGDWGKAMKMFEDSGIQSPLGNALTNDLKNIAKITTAYLPVVIGSIGATDVEVVKFQSVNVSLTVHAMIDFFTSQKYKFRYDEKARKMEYVPDGYTTKQMMLTAGVGVKYRPRRFTSVGLTLSGEIPHGVKDDTGEPVYLQAGNTQGVLAISVRDRSGKLRLFNIPIYAGARLAWRFPSNQVSVGTSLGVGVAKTKTFGQIVVLADFGVNFFDQDKTEYAQALSKYLWRAGVGIQPGHKLVETLHLYYIQTEGGQPGGAGLKVDSTIGGGAELRTWKGIKVRVEGRYRRAAEVLGIPLKEGRENVMAIIGIDFGEALSRWISGKRR